MFAKWKGNKTMENGITTPVVPQRTFFKGEWSEVTNEQMETLKVKYPDKFDFTDTITKPEEPKLHSPEKKEVKKTKETK